MHFQKVHGDHAPERVFRSVVNASSSVAIARGDTVLWDVVVNTGTAGIMTDTRGARVLRNPGTRSSIRVAGVAEMAGPVTATGQFRNDGFSICVSGFHDAVQVENTVAQDSLLVASNTAGMAEQAAVPATPTVQELQGRMGWTLAARTGAGTVPCMLRGLL